MDSSIRLEPIRSHHSLLTVLHWRRAWLLVALAVCGFSFYSAVQAVTPSPDGGYANGNTAEGSNALFSLTAGVKNTANGYLALFSNTTGQLNTAIGSQALYTNSTGSNNTAAGFDVLFHNITGNDNTAAGYLALFHNRSGADNTAVGSQALTNNTNGTSNTAVGSGALSFNTTGFGNAAFGGGAAAFNTTGVLNTAIGNEALLHNITGTSNTAIGNSALLINSNGKNNTAVGVSALQESTGNFNTALGISAGTHVFTASNVICIGALGGDVSNSCFIGNIRGVTTANANAIPVLIDSAGQLGTASSSRRFKQDIKPMETASEAVLALKPVTFHYKSDKTDTPQFGLIAEEVVAVNPDLVVRDKNGEIYTVRYDAVNAMLLNEFLKEHRKVQELGTTVAQLESVVAKQDAIAARQQKEIGVLTADLKDQARQFQKLSTQIETSKPASQVVLTDHN